MAVATAPLLYYLAQFFRDFVFRKQVAQVVAWTSPANSKKITTFLEHSFPYYKLLSSTEKDEFVNRVQMVLQYKFFEGRDNLEITDEIAFGISAVWVQLTFGLSRYLSAEYDRIVVVPDVMVSAMGNTYLFTLHKKASTVQIAWKPFRKGYTDNKDRHSPGLEVCARLLVRDYFMLTEIEKDYDEWARYAAENNAHIDAARQTLFNVEDFLNMEDVWVACCIALFEAPVEFEATLPELYRLTAKTLNQHMATRIHNTKSLNS